MAKKTTKKTTTKKTSTEKPTPTKPEKNGFLSKLFNKDAGVNEQPSMLRMQAIVSRIGKSFEFHRGNFNPDYVDETSAGLDRLYMLFDVAPVPRRIVHNGKSPIVAKSVGWQDQHQELWEFLVPSSGPAANMQGELIRISGRINDELGRNGGLNWTHDHRKMAKAYLQIIRSGTPLDDDALAEADAVIKGLNKNAEASILLSQRATDWVALNPDPMKLPKPEYGI